VAFTLLVTVSSSSELDTTFVIGTYKMGKLAKKFAAKPNNQQLKTMVTVSDTSSLLYLAVSFCSPDGDMHSPSVRAATLRESD
jgi:hypothetical protein